MPVPRDVDQTPAHLEVLRLLSSGLGTDDILEMVPDLQWSDIAAAAQAGSAAILELRRRGRPSRGVMGRPTAELTPHERLVRKVFDRDMPVRPQLTPPRPRTAVPHAPARSPSINSSEARPRSAEKQERWTEHQLQVRQSFPRAWEPWSEIEESVLRESFGRGLTVNEIAKDLQRRPGAVHSRLKKLGLVD